METTNRGASRWLTVAAILIVLAGLFFISLNLAQNVDSNANLPALEADSEAAITQTMLRIGDDLQCPICEGQSVAFSNSRLAAEMREQITEQLQAGATEAEIKQYFVDRYGVIVLREPPRTGFNLLLWQMPFIAIGVGILILCWTLIQTRRNKQRAAVMATENISRDAESLDAVDPEIRELLAQYDEELFGDAPAK